MIFAISLNKNIYTMDVVTAVNFAFYILYIASLFIIAGIDKENIKIQKSLLVFGLILSFFYMIYACILDKNYIYTYIIYLILTVILLFTNIIFIKKKTAQSYTIEILMLILYMSVFTESLFIYETIILTFILITIQMIIEKIKKNKDNGVCKLNIPIGFYLCVSNILLIIIRNFLCNWVI